MELEVPDFIKYYLLKISKSIQKYGNSERAIEDVHTRFLRALAQLHASGRKYEEVLNDAALNKIRSYIADTFDLKSYPSIQTLVNYTYTRDEISNPFGPWVNFEYTDPLVYLDYANYINTDKNLKRDVVGLAGMYFTLKLIYQVTESRTETYSDASDSNEYITDKSKSQEQKVVNLYRPSLFYRIASISQESFTEYANEIGLLYEYNHLKRENSYGVKLNLSNVEELLKDIERFKDENKGSYHIDTHNCTKSSLDLYKQDKAFTRLCNAYETRYLRDKSSRLHLMPMEGNPFLRLYNKGNQLYITTQLYLANYILILNSLHNNYNPMPKISARHGRTKLEKVVNDLRDKLMRNGLYNKVDTISSPITLREGRHFEQISKITPKIQRISNTGILIDIDKAHEMLNQEIDMQVYDEKRRHSIKCEIDTYDPNYGIDYIPAEYGQESTSEDPELEAWLNEGKKETDHIEVTPEDNITQHLKEIDSSISIENKINTLKRIIEAATSMKSGGSNRIFGLFTPHGASTHRLNCRNLPLQGIPKSLKKELFITPDGWQLISADVSGQDIMVTANIAKRVFRDYAAFPDISKERLDGYASLLEGTFEKLKGMNAKTRALRKPINYITNQIMRNKLRL